MILKQVYIFFFLTLFFVNCSNQETENTPNTLYTNKEKWFNSSVVDYTYVFQISCYCIEESTRPKSVLVRNGLIVNVNNENFNEETHSYVLTINDLFYEIENATNQGAAKLDVNYDTKYGFPYYLFIDRYIRIADEEISYSVSDFKPL